MFGAGLSAREPAHVRFQDTFEHSNRLKLRSWAWQHWAAHRAGTATVEWTAVEGESGTSEYTIAKGHDGTWYLSIHRQGSERPMFDGDTAKWRDEWTIAHSVERVEEPYQRDWPGKPISHSRPLPPRKFVLELKDKEGKILTHI